jgi:hypothetical protein
MGLTSEAAGYPMVRPVEKHVPDSPNPTTVHHQCEPMLTINQKFLTTKNRTTYTKPYESEVR